jgi:DNA-binding LacI/PurR family transcriptional regulator
MRKGKNELIAFLCKADIEYGKTIDFDTRVMGSIFSPVISGFVDSCRKHQFNFHLYTKQHQIDAFLSGKIKETYDGVVVLKYQFTGEERDLVDDIAKKIPLVNLLVESSDFHNVSQPDSKMGMNILVDYLLEKGITKFGFYMHSDRHFETKRLSAFKEALSKKGIFINPDWIYENNQRTNNPNQYNAFTNSFDKILLTSKKPEVVLFCHDFEAYKFYNYAVSKNIKIPQDISITGFDNSTFNFVPHGYKFLTTIKVNYEDLSRMGVLLLQEIISTERPTSGQKINVPVRLIEGFSINTKDGVQVYSDDLYFKEYVSDYLENHLDSHNLAPYLASNAEVTLNYFYKKIKHIFGKGFNELITTLRIDRACFLLRSTNRSVTNILFEVGYKSYQSFTYAFKQQTNITPKEYRSRYIASHKNS